MSLSAKGHNAFGARIKKVYTRITTHPHTPNVLVGGAFALAAMAIRLRSPTLFGLVLSGIAQQLRVTHTSEGIRISIAGLPSSAWSLLIPLSKRFEHIVRGLQPTASNEPENPSSLTKRSARTRRPNV